MMALQKEKVLITLGTCEYHVKNTGKGKKGGTVYYE